MKQRSNDRLRFTHETILRCFGYFVNKTESLEWVKILSMNAAKGQVVKSLFFILKCFSRLATLVFPLSIKKMCHKPVEQEKENRMTLWIGIKQLTH